VKLVAATAIRFIAIPSGRVRLTLYYKFLVMCDSE